MTPPPETGGGDVSLTVSTSEPELACRRQPLRVLLDSNLKTPAAAKIFSAAAPTLLCHRESLAVPEDIARTPAELLALPDSGQGLALVPLLEELAMRQCNEILVESGPRLAGALLQQGLLDELIIYTAPSLMGSKARPLLELPIDTMAEKVQLELVDVRKVGQDWRFTALPAS